MSVKAITKGTLARSNTTGVLTLPAAGLVPTSDGAGGAVWSIAPLSGESKASLASADATSYSVAANPWTASTGVSVVSPQSQAYIPSINRIVGGGDGVGNGAIYSDDGGITWSDATTSSASSGVVGYSPSLGVVAWRLATEVQTSADNGINYTPRTAFSGSGGVSSNNILWVESLGLFVAGDYAAAKIATSPNGITWTLRASATREVQTIILAGTTLVTCGSSGQMKSSDGITWTNTSSTAMYSCAYSPELELVAFAPSAASTNMYTSTDFGTTLTALNVKPSTALYRAFLWSSTLGSFILPQTGSVAGEVNIYTWKGDSQPFIGGIANRFAFGSGTSGADTAIYGIFEYPAFNTLVAVGNAAGGCFYSKYLQTNQSVATSGSGSLSGQALFLAPGAAQTSWAASKSQLYFDSTSAELRHRFNSINYPLAGAKLRTSGRFDGTAIQTLFNDGVVLFNWDIGTNQVRAQFATTSFFGATKFESAIQFFFSAVAPLVATSESSTIAATTNYFLTTGTVSEDATFNMTKATPMYMTAAVWPATLSVATTPYYEINIRLSPSAGYAGNFSVEKIYTP